MALWGVVAGVYGVVLAGTAVCLPIARRPVAAAACLAYALVAFGAGSLRPDDLAISAPALELTAGPLMDAGSAPPVDLFGLVAPGALLLAGYWLSGFFFRDPQRWLEKALIASDQWVFRAFAHARSSWRTPPWALELLEASYAAVYVVVAAGAFIAASAGTRAVAYYWTLVLASELACYAMLPWLRSRPPRVLEQLQSAAGDHPDRPHRTGHEPPDGPIRRLNAAILERASVQANTLPSGHVAGAVAAALGVWPVAATAGPIFLIVAGVIAVSAVTGRYHYVVDCVSGGAVSLVVAVALSLLM